MECEAAASATGPESMGTQHPPLPYNSDSPVPDPFNPLSNPLSVDLALRYGRIPVAFDEPAAFGAIAAFVHRAPPAQMVPAGI